MTRDEILNELQIIISETRGVDEEEVVSDANLFNDLGLESIDFLEISFRMEESFGFPFPTDDLGKLMSSVNENSTKEDVESVLDRLEGDFYIAVERSKVEGIDPIDADKLRDSVLNLFSVGVLVNFVEKKQAA
jgi:acyl carrier protein